MANELTVKLKPNVVVGSAANDVSFDLESSAELKNLIARISVPCGKKEGGTTYLLGQKLDSILLKTGRTPELMTPVVTEAEERVWQTTSLGFRLGPDNKLTIQLSKFSASQGEGTAHVALKIWQKGSQDKPLHEEIHSIEVSLPAGEPLSILYFAPNRNSVLPHEKIVISTYTTGAKLLILYGNNDVEIARDLTKPEETAKVNRAVRFSLNNPGGNTRYILDAWRDKVEPDRRFAIQEKRLATTEATVFVLEQGDWKTRDLVAGCYPTLLVSSGGTGDVLTGLNTPTLYGVFVNPATKERALYSSTSGLEDWVFQSAIPEGMAESPGVLYRDKLWLIGGCSADPKGPRSNKVWCYYKQPDNSMDWKPLDSAPFSPRMGHACVVFEDRIWVLGGLSKPQEPLHDVWTCYEPKTEGEKQPGVSYPQWSRQPEAPWTGRCMFAAVVTGIDQRFAKPFLWIYGGTEHPYDLNAKDDLWQMDVDNKWNSDTPLPPEKLGIPLGAALLYDNATLRLAGKFYDPQLKSDSRSGERSLSTKSFQYSLESTRPFSWDSTGIDWKWEFNQTDVFLIRSVAFNGLRIYWPLYQDMNGMTNKNPRIYIV